MASEYLKWKYKDVRREPERVLTPQEKRANWWYYHKWYVAAALLLLFFLSGIVRSQIQNYRNRPDLCVACVTRHPLAEDTLQALRDTFSSNIEDIDGNRRVVVEIRTYLTPDSNDPSVQSYRTGDQVRLMADLEACESVFFILEDPEAFQASYEILADTERPYSDCTDSAAGGFYISCADCPSLSGILPDASFARRVLRDGSRAASYVDQYDGLWRSLREK